MSESEDLPPLEMEILPASPESPQELADALSSRTALL